MTGCVHTAGPTEICGNGVDDNCDGVVDQGQDAVGCTSFYADLDQDGFGTFDSQCLCAPSGIYTASVSGDCNDGNAAVNPGHVEICGNGIDDNCNGKLDEADGQGCSNYYKDLDTDGYGAGAAECLCAPSAVYNTAKNGDCDDSNPLIGPGATEICGNGIDDDCDGIVDNPGICP